MKCRITNRDWKAIFVFDTVGAGFLTFRKLTDTKSVTCALVLDFINDGRGAEVPDVRIEFKRAACDPELGSLEGEILKSLTLIINSTEKGRPVGQIQWLRKKQPEQCDVEKISMNDIRLDTQKWRAGNWGRSTASDPKATQKLKGQ